MRNSSVEIFATLIFHEQTAIQSPPLIFLFPHNSWREDHDSRWRIQSVTWWRKLNTKYLSDSHSRVNLWRKKTLAADANDEMSSIISRRLFHCHSSLPIGHQTMTPWKSVTDVRTATQRRKKKLEKKCIDGKKGSRHGRLV